MDKQRLRGEYSEMRAGLTASQIAELSILITDRFFGRFDLSRFKFIHVFKSLEEKREVDTEPLIERIRKEFPALNVCVPKIDKDSKTMKSAVLETETELEPNFWGIPEPVEPEIVPDDVIDLVIVPLLCFDGAGHRVGYGGGYYDKFLANCRPDCVKAGVSFFPPVDAIDGITDRDVRLDHCVTPDRTWSFVV